MSKALADIFGSTGTNFVAQIDSGSIVQATLKGQILAAGPDNQSVVVPSLPAGDSIIDLRVVFGPGDPDANIGVGAVTSGAVQAQVPPGRVLNQFSVGAIKLFGE
jgi:hypothetical protein